jgi:PPOX class probable F420-dependent enzyme
MTVSKLDAFNGQAYLNLETFRRSGEGVQTPVWFVEHEGRLYVRTRAEAWKVKRIRRNPRVRVAPCDVQGNLLGEWVEGQARVMNEAEADFISRLARQKYGFRKTIFDILNKLLRHSWVVIEIRL